MHYISIDFESLEVIIHVYQVLLLEKSGFISYRNNSFVTHPPVFNLIYLIWSNMLNFF